LKESVILFRKDLATESEFNIAQQHFKVYQYRSELPSDSLVVGRYSVLPNYNELEIDLHNNNSSLINSYKQHQFVADITQWAACIPMYTPTTWSNVQEIPIRHDGPFVVKGRTNSRKHSWSTRMFAPNRAQLGTVIGSLLDDALISDQGIVIREYVPLEKILDGINGLPITYEFRVFVCNNQIIGHGFYWSSYAEQVKEILGYIPNLNQSKYSKGLDLCYKVIEELSINPNCPRFYTIDIAKDSIGNWIVIELNDGQMSGLSEVDMEMFYKGLKANL